MDGKIKILVADDHPLLLKGLCDELSLNNYIVLQANNGKESLEVLLKNHPDIAILDIEMPYYNAFEVIKKYNETLQKKTKFIILTSHKEKAFILKAKELNISGYLLKDEPFSEIENCINEVANGNTYFSKTFTAIFNSEVSPEIRKINYLSPSEKTIVRLIALDKTTKEISDLLFISTRTVEKHRANIITKLDLSPKVNTLNEWVAENKDIILTAIKK